MNNKVLFLNSPMKEKLYGGTRIQEKFGFTNDMDRKIGEYWVISAHDNGPSIVANGDYQGQSLKEVYAKHRELFANDQSPRFPLLVKVNEVQQPVSVQVHPNDEYAKEHENDLGKAEFCLYMGVEPGTKIIRGHTAQTKEEFKDLIEKKDFDTLLVRKEVKDNDFVYTPAGVVHGIEGVLMMAEVQQSSDATYRIYDYDRQDDQGNYRDLHIDKAVDVTCIPHKEPEMDVKESEINGNKVIEYVNNEFFKITRYFISNEVTLNNPKYSLVLVMNGNGTITVDGQSNEIKAGMGCIVTSQTKQYTLNGDLEVLISEPPLQ